MVDVKKEKGERKSDLTQMAYYMEKDVRQSVFQLNTQWLDGLKRVPLTHRCPFCVIFSMQVKVLPLFNEQAKFEPTVDGQKLEMENILVYYVDEVPPTFTMKALTGGIIAVIVVVVLAVVAGLLILVSASVFSHTFSMMTMIANV